MPRNQPGSPKPQAETTQFHTVLLITQNKQARGEQKGCTDNTASPLQSWWECVESSGLCTCCLGSGVPLEPYRHHTEMILLPQVPNAPPENQGDNVMSHLIYIVFYIIIYYAIISIIIYYSLITPLREFK